MRGGDSIETEIQRWGGDLIGTEIHKGRGLANVIETEIQRERGLNRD